MAPSGIGSIGHYLPDLRENRSGAGQPAIEMAQLPAVDGGAPQEARHPRGDGGFRMRMKKLFNTQAVPHEPALRLTGNWENDIAPLLCQLYVDSQHAYKEDDISRIALSRMKALDYERKEGGNMRDGERILPWNSTPKHYYEAQAKAFMETLGIRGEEAEKVLESFKQAGTGGLHRQHVLGAATAGTAVGAAAQFASAQHPAAAAALYGIRVLLQALTTERILDSGWRRLRNAGTEDMLPLGRADAAPGAKQAPTLFQASHAVIWELGGVEKNLRKLEAAMIKLNDARNAQGEDVAAAKNALEIAFARICYQLAVKAEYKVSSESAKIEFRGNQRYLATSYAGTGLTFASGIFSIVAPLLGIGAAAAPATGGVSAGVAALVIALYIGYQLSSGPSKDGEAKAKRAIVALSKSLDVLNWDKAVHQAERAAAYKSYLEEKKAARFKLGSAKSEARENAKARLLARLTELSNKDQVRGFMSPQENWKAYRDHRAAVSNIEARVASEALSREGADVEIARLESQFDRDHKADFSAKTISDAWKSPMRLRMEAAARLLNGKVAQSCKHLINLTQHPSMKARLNRNGRERATEKIKEELQANLRNVFRMEFALRHMKLRENETALSEGSKNSAINAIAAIDDPDVRNLFSGNGEEQIEAVNKSKKLTAGEAQRYVYTNAGASALGIGLNAAVAATDLGLFLAKATGAVHVGLHDPNPEGKTRIPKVPDYKEAALSQYGATFAAHLNAGDRAAFQKTQMPNVLAPTTREQNGIIEPAVELLDDNNGPPANDGAQAALLSVDAFVDQIETSGAIPDKITLTMALPFDAPGPSSAPAATSVHEITIDLRKTSAYHSARYQELSFTGKTKVAKAKAGVIGRHAAMAIAGLPAQAIAQINLRKTRPALQRAAELSERVRKELMPGTTPGQPLAPRPAHQAREAGDGSSV